MKECERKIDQYCGRIRNVLEVVKQRRTKVEQLKQEADRLKREVDSLCLKGTLRREVRGSKSTKHKKLYIRQRPKPERLQGETVM